MLTKLFSETRWSSGRASDCGARGRGFDPHSGRRVVSLSKIHLPPKSTGNTQEAVAPSAHDDMTESLNPNKNNVFLPSNSQFYFFKIHYQASDLTH